MYRAEKRSRRRLVRRNEENTYSRFSCHSALIDGIYVFLFTYPLDCESTTEGMVVGHGKDCGRTTGPGSDEPGPGVRAVGTRSGNPEANQCRAIMGCCRADAERAPDSRPRGCHGQEGPERPCPAHCQLHQTGRVLRRRRDQPLVPGARPGRRRRHHLVQTRQPLRLGRRPLRPCHTPRTAMRQAGAHGARADRTHGTRRARADRTHGTYRTYGTHWPHRAYGTHRPHRSLQHRQHRPGIHSPPHTGTWTDHCFGRRLSGRSKSHLRRLDGRRRGHPREQLPQHKLQP